ncbi:MAG: hypothetical protein GY795_21615 [Desulfobacterales bacterium]|nr:hypothetical protein [Desulfobacterales bacterium]
MARKVERSDKNANPILSMFTGMPKVFWLGMAIMYGWCFMFMIIEMRVPGFPLKKVFGVPACYIYNWIMALWVINIIVSFLFFRAEEKREEEMEKQS